MRARNLLLTICVGSCLTLACGDDDDDATGNVGGTHTEAGAPDVPAKGGTGGSPSIGGSAGKAGNPSGEAGEPNPGMGGRPPEPGSGGGGGDGDASFVGFVHDLVRDHTSDTESPASVDRQFREEQDDHDHYLTPSDAFADLF
jgi:hypothetical protein